MPLCDPERLSFISRHLRLPRTRGRGGVLSVRAGPELIQIGEQRTAYFPLHLARLSAFNYHHPFASMPPKSTQVPAHSSRPAIRSLRGGARVRAPGPTRLPVGPISSGNDHITTTGVKRAGFGVSGRKVKIMVNAFPTTVPDCEIYQYDVISSDKTAVLPARFNMELFKLLQTEVAPEVFTKRAVYDGRKIAFTVKKLLVNEKGSVEFKVPYGMRPAGPNAGPPRIFKIKLTEAAVINPEVLKRFIAGNHSQENSVLTAITALNVVIRMEPSLNHPFNVRSFFTNSQTKPLRLGIELWRGYFQSVRPTIGSMFINIDISTGAMYMPGELPNVLFQMHGDEKIGLDRRTFVPGIGLKTGDIRKLSRQISGVRVTVRLLGRPDVERVLKKLSLERARDIRFTSPKDGPTNVVDHILRTYSIHLRNPDWICAEVGNGAFIPIELCQIKPGQIMRKQISGDVIAEVRDFSTMRPEDRMRSIRKGIEVLAYGQSEYVRHFGMSLTSGDPLRVEARVLAPPVLSYSRANRQAQITPLHGTWNMVDKSFYEPKTITTWSLVIFELKNKFNETQCADMVKGFMKACRIVGIKVLKEPRITWYSGQGTIENALRDEASNRPTLIVAVLPVTGNASIYNRIKHFGDCVAGVPTQCMISSKCCFAKAQYFANVCLKVNVKLGGINLIPSSESVPALTDVRHPTMIIGADVMHPPPGANDRPSYTAVVGSVDSHTARYVAKMQVQKGRQEIIEHFESMCKELIEDYCSYHMHMEKKAQAKPERIIVYRDGVSEGQFKEVLDTELAALKAACKSLGVNAKITFIIVGKRHHIRFFPIETTDKDRSGNCHAGTVVDRGIGHPTEFDFYLQSHGGLLGTSRPSHYSVLHDENKMIPDDLQSLTNALCYVYARSTRAVSIPAPVYYADTVCSRANHHFSPDSHLGPEEDWSASSDAGSGTPAEILERYQQSFKPVHKDQKKRMYFQ
ncbi:argonaute-like protein [Armillaria novae-zelandiae]|uniref:Argonaute-like protein n=1 Tax=Armillaria novae-zelandiae TaxID=153914 RepID=A0AA39TC15_9AGAR|nr:argonaute-like protein [Armillaria novae-zelandiae]